MLSTEKELPRLSRLSATLTLLQTKRIVSAPELAAHFGVSVRTVYRDIRALEDSGIPICTEEGKGYSLVEGFSLPPVMLSQSEANALLTAEKILVNNSDASLAKEYQAAIAKIKAVMRFPTKEKLEILQKRMVVRKSRTEAQSPQSTYLSTLQMAITDSFCVEIVYESLHDHATSERVVEPLGVYTSQDGNWVLVAWCRLRNEHRSFRLDCIRRLTLLYEQCPKPEFSLEEYFAECLRLQKYHT